MQRMPEKIEVAGPDLSVDAPCRASFFPAAGLFRFRFSVPLKSAPSPCPPLSSGRAGAGRFGGIWGLWGRGRRAGAAKRGESPGSKGSCAEKARGPFPAVSAGGRSAQADSSAYLKKENGRPALFSLSPGRPPGAGRDGETAASAPPLRGRPLLTPGAGPGRKRRRKALFH